MRYRRSSDCSAVDNCSAVDKNKSKLHGESTAATDGNTATEKLDGSKHVDLGKPALSDGHDHAKSDGSMSAIADLEWQQQQ